MSEESARTAAILARIDTVERRLTEQAERPLPPSREQPTSGDEERWDAGQIWAHMAEALFFHLGQARRIAANPSPEPAPLGRPPTHEVRLSAIEAGRYAPPAVHLERLRAGLAELRDFVRGLSPEAWSKRSRHMTRGEMDLHQVVMDFMLDHLDQHLAQLQSLSEPV